MLFPTFFYYSSISKILTGKFAVLEGFDVYTLKYKQSSSNVLGCSSANSGIYSNISFIPLSFCIGLAECFVASSIPFHGSGLKRKLFEKSSKF